MLINLKHAYAVFRRWFPEVAIALIIGLFLSVFNWLGNTVTEAKDASKKACTEVQQVKIEVDNKLNSVDKDLNALEKGNTERTKTYEKLSEQIQQVSGDLREMKGSLTFIVDALKNGGKK